ncbi:MAG: energy-coupling factor transporter ATPase [Eubacteriales bacterium]|nr:energy-coupling factor transporter ATPase [Eubacteriales bacterium]MDD3881559.1 energy-coupling factor transporter ATPase [Eubacteriales bacterium]MDD4513371.1 energy-coupling factor transporter ATPase [Eubacteriales bacterium]
MPQAQNDAMVSADAENGVCVSVRDVSFHYEDASENALTDISLDIKSGEFVAVLGHNGSGKSTLAKLINALYLPSDGSVFVCGIDTKNEDKLWDIRRNAGMVFQNPDNQLVANIVEDDVAFGLENIAVPNPEMEGRITEALSAVNMLAFRKYSPNMLSGGQKQRVAIAGILAMKPRIIVMDESTAMLDPSGRAEVLKTAQHLNKAEGITVIWITHFMEEAATADRVIVINDSKAVMSGTPREVFSQVDVLRSMRLDVPPMTQLCQLLSKGGMDIPTDLLTVSEVFDYLGKIKPEKASDVEDTPDYPAPQGEAMVELKALSHIYAKNTPYEAVALSDIDLSIWQGEFIGLIGHTGSGKSTLIQHLNGLEDPTSGEVLFRGENINDKSADKRALRRKVGLVFQYPENQLFEETVSKDIAFGPKNLGLSPDEIKERVEYAAKMVGLNLSELGERSPFELSGGQMRRVAIAGVIAMKPELLILDEPIAGLDPQGRDDITDMLENLHKEGGITILMVSHNMDDIARISTRLIVMNTGKLVMSGTPRTVFSHCDELKAIGLNVPHAAQLARLLRNIDWQIPADIYDLDTLSKHILSAWGGDRQ